MLNRHGILRAIIVSCLFAGAVASASAQEKAARPNIILCMADDQGWGDVGYNGHPVLKTPNLDALASVGLRFDRFYAAAPVCSPTRGSVMTGRHPNRFGCFSPGHTLRPQETTLAEVLKSAGYVTGHFGKWHLGSVQRTSPVNPGASGFGEWFSAPNFYDNDPILSRGGIAVPMKGESSMVAVDAALEFIRKHTRGPKPLFVVVWFGSPHVPHEASPENFALYPDQQEKQRHFYGEITGLDRALGKLRKELRTLGIHQNTLLWYCSDNGGLPGLGTTGGRGNKGSIYEGGLRVPGIIEWPARISRPRRTSIPAGTVDIFPTLLEIAGAHPEAGRPLDGISLVPLIDGKMKTRPRPLGFWDYPAKGVVTPTRAWMSDLLEAQKRGNEVDDQSRLNLEAGKIARQYPEDAFLGHAAWLEWPWKLHRIEGKDGAIKIELYDLAVDPQEETDLAARQPERVQSMHSDLEKWLASVAASLNGKDY